MSVVVRRLRPDEALPFRELRLRALADAPAAFGSTHAEERTRPLAFWMDRTHQSSTSADSAIFVAEVGEAWVGLAGGYREDPDDAAIQLVSMWVAPDGRRLGTGKLLVDAVLDWSRSVGATRVDLWVTRSNDPAYELYRSFGFEPDGAYQPLPSDPCKEEVRMGLRLES